MHTSLCLSRLWLASCCLRYRGSFFLITSVGQMIKTHPRVISAKWCVIGGIAHLENITLFDSGVLSMKLHQREKDPYDQI
ncbi:hypothetical protein F4820DRAFT_426236 [Hypoxylon rubiginosum]|uniref:Uncharacterized protein n=1 Tax=Hypoxylon rubiginosum TaxID=110542 RepID=A0ACB9YY94_9PEZI|nr:hypothetical protein F4820DRAFT_426236 [Hypoxylon rubiginosum]